jgi:hypothetical protein
VEWAYQEAFNAVQNDTLLAEAERDYVYPHYRRAIIEKRLRDSFIGNRIGTQNGLERCPELSVYRDRRRAAAPDLFSQRRPRLAYVEVIIIPTAACVAQLLAFTDALPVWRI